jgi:hypothetical protein
MEEIKKKKCSGCKSEKPLDNNHFYKNKLVLDGHSNYCIDCTRENSKRYFQRKKEKISKMENDNLVKMAFLNNNPQDGGLNSPDNLVKILMIEKMIQSISQELGHLKNSCIKNENVFS